MAKGKKHLEYNKVLFKKLAQKQSGIKGFEDKTSLSAWKSDLQVKTLGLFPGNRCIPDW